MQHQNQEKQIRLLAYLFLIQAEFILVRQVKNVLKCIIMTMPFGSSTRISSVSFFKRAWGLCTYCLINSQSVSTVGRGSRWVLFYMQKNKASKRLSSLPKVAQ